MKIFLDANVILDVLAKRRPFYRSSASVLTLAEEGRVEAFLAAHSVTTIYYLMQKNFGRGRANAAIIDLLNLVKVAAVDGEALKEALSLNWKDYEDAVQAVAAIKSKCTHFITRNIRDFSNLTLKVMTPEEWLTISDFSLKS